MCKINSKEDLLKVKDTKRKIIYNLDKDVLPWLDKTNPKALPQSRIFYHIVLGVIDYGKVIDALLQVYGDSNPNQKIPQSMALAATAIVDSKGILIENSPITISSFAWGIEKALHGDLNNLETWGKEQIAIVSTFEEHLKQLDENGNPMPVNSNMIFSAKQWLFKKLNIPDFL